MYRSELIIDTQRVFLEKPKKDKILVLGMSGSLHRTCLVGLKLPAVRKLYKAFGVAIKEIEALG